MSRPWMPFFVADYLADTSHLSTLEHGAYLLLIMHYWANGGLPNDDQKLARITRLSDRDWQKIKATIEKFFDGDWKHCRIDVELAITDEKRDARAKAGHKGGIASASLRRQRKQKSSNATSFATAKVNQSEPEPLLDKNSEARASDAGASPPVYTDSKHELWGEGVPILVSLGVKNREARSNIGRWLRDAKEDAQQVLGAIQRARDARVIDPVPWITRALSTGEKPNANARDNSLKGALARLGAYTEAADRPGISEGSEAPPRLLSNG